MKVNAPPLLFAAFGFAMSIITWIVGPKMLDAADKSEATPGGRAAFMPFVRIASVGFALFGIFCVVAAFGYIKLRS